MQAALLIFIGLLSCAAATTKEIKEKKLICYYLSWLGKRPGNENFTLTNIDLKLCTHLIYVGARLGPNGVVSTGNPQFDLPENGGQDGYNVLNQLRNQNLSLKTMVNVGHVGRNSTMFSQMVANSTTRKAFVSNAVNFVKSHHFNGLDLDWVYPNEDATYRRNFVVLLKELWQAFDKEGLLLSVHILGLSTNAYKYYNVPEIAKYVHFINLINDQLHLPSQNVTGNSAPLYAGSWEQGNDLLLNVESIVFYWLSQGAPAEKLIVRVPFFGVSYTLANVSETEIGAPTSGLGAAGPYTTLDGILSYREICEKQISEKWTIRFNDQQQVPYTFRGNQWISYDNVESVIEKAKFIHKLGLGGVSVWSINFDDFDYPLLTALNQVLRNSRLLNTLEDIWKSFFNVFKNYKCINEELDCNIFIGDSYGCNEVNKILF